MDPLLINTKEAAAVLGVCKAHFIVLANAGRVGPQSIRMSRRVLYRADELRDWVSAGCPCRREWQARQPKGS